MKRSILLLLPALMLLWVLCSCSSQDSVAEERPAADGDKADSSIDSKSAGKKRADKQDDTPPPVRVVTLEKRDVMRSVTVSGLVTSNHDVTVLSETAGRVVKDNMTLGKDFRSGEVLLEVDSEPYRIQVQIAEGNLETARAAAGNAEREYNRLKTLHDSGDVSDSQFDQVRTAWENSKAALKIAEAGLMQANRSLRLSSVRAPFNGIVAARLVKLGDTISQGSPVVQLVDTQSIKVEVGVGEDHIGWLAIGHKALVAFPTLKIDAVPAEVSAVGLKALSPTMTYPVELVLENRPPEVRVGMVNRVTMDVGETINAITVPLEILVDRFDKNYLYVIKDNTTQERLVELGLEIGRDVIVLSGVVEGEQVAVSGQANLKDGMTVSVVE